MAIAFVQQNQALTTASAATIAAAFLSNTTSGNSIIVGVCSAFVSSSAGYVGSISDGTNTYVQLNSPLWVGQELMNIWIAKNITGAVTPTITVTFAGANTRGAMDILEVSGLALNQPVDYITDVFQIPGSASKFGIDTPSPKTPSNLVYMYAGQAIGSATFTVGSGFTNLQQQTSVAAGPGSSARQLKINAPQTPLSSIITTSSTTAQGIASVAVFSDTDLPPFHRPLGINNYQQLRVGDGMSVSEKIR